MNVIIYDYIKNYFRKNFVESYLLFPDSSLLFKLDGLQNIQSQYIEVIKENFCDKYDVTDIKNGKLDSEIEKVLDNFVNMFFTDNMRKNCHILYNYVKELLIKKQINSNYNEDMLDHLIKSIVVRIYPQYDKTKLNTKEIDEQIIVVYKDLFNYLENEDELAGILAHEISHSVDYSQGAFKGYFSVISTNLAPKKYEYKADKRAVDYVVKAGYNPLGIITAVQKIASQPRYDWYLSHPLTSKRTATVYEYIYTKYPEYLVQNEYKDNLVYQNFLLTSKENRKKLEKKVSSGSKKQIKYQ